MTEREREILELIRKNPAIEQEELAKYLGLKRSTVAVHIASLQKQGYLYRGYLFNDENYVVGIGAANIDMYGKSSIPIKPQYDHPGHIFTSAGGVTRNILENVSRLGYKTKLISAVGNDLYGQFVLKESESAGVDTSDVLVVNGENTGIFMQVMDSKNDMHLALCDMSVNKHINADYIRSKRNVLRSAKLILLDPSLEKNVIEDILEEYKDVDIYVDPISENYAKAIKPYIGKFTVAKPNLNELQALSGRKINNIDDAKKACQTLLNKGLKKIFVSLGKDGVLYMDKQGNVINRKFKHLKKVVNASGAGDSFMGAVIYCAVNGIDIDKTIDYALAAGIAALNNENTINTDMSVSLLDKIIEENKR